MSSEISPELIRKLVTYEPATGRFYWNERGPEMFGKDNPEAESSYWNENVAGTETFLTNGSRGGLYASILGKTMQAHNVAWMYVHCMKPKTYLTHINGDRRDNRICNLAERANRLVERRVAMPFTISKSKLSLADIAEAITVDTFNGTVYHKERDPKFFATDEQWREWNDRYAGKPITPITDDNGYVYHSIRGVSIKRSHIVWAMVNGRMPNEGLVIDHKDGVTDNDRPENLRETTRSLNSKNRKPSRNVSEWGTSISYERRDKKTPRFRVSIYHEGVRFSKRFRRHEDALRYSIAEYERLGYSERHSEWNIELLNRITSNNPNEPTLTAWL